MTAFPDFAVHGYQVIKELGHNLEGGRFTYLAKRLADNTQVVIKQFQFSKGAGWDGFRAIEREIQSLQGLNHRGIPKYLDKFETDNGYCLVTEYFPADTLAVGRSFTPDQIKQIAVQILEILVYLQERMPPVIHRDVKPENILVDNNLNVYLIDFGFARVGSGSVAMSSANAGTFGFMAPEQIRNLKLTNASDLYGLGLTLICLIGAIRSTDIGNYIDFSNQLDRSRIEPKLKGCSLTFVKWLDRMVAPDPSKRFTDAKAALEALKPLYVVRVPEVKFFKDGNEFDPSKDVLEFKATKLGEKLTQTITLVNSIPETILEGHWEVALHPNDPPHNPDNHAWISFSPKKIKGNRVQCNFNVDTGKLQSQSLGKRHLVFYSYSSPDEIVLSLKIETAYPVVWQNLYIYFLGIIHSVFVIVSGFALGWGWIVAFSVSQDVGVSLFIALAIAFLGSLVMTIGSAGAASSSAYFTVFASFAAIKFRVDIWSFTVLLSGIVSGIIASMIDTEYKGLSQKYQRFFGIQFWGCYILSNTCGFSIGIGIATKFVSPILPVLTALGSGIALLCLSLFPLYQHRSQLIFYRRKEEHLIKP